MGKLANPAAFSKALSLQKANARAKRSRAVVPISENAAACAPTSSPPSLRHYSIIELPIDEAAAEDPKASFSSVMAPHEQDTSLTSAKRCFSTLNDRSVANCSRTSSQLTARSAAGKREDGSSSSTSWSEASFSEETIQAQGGVPSTFVSDGSNSCGDGLEGPQSSRGTDQQDFSTPKSAETSADEKKNAQKNANGKFMSQALRRKLIKASTVIRRGCYQCSGQGVPNSSTEDMDCCDTKCSTYAKDATLSGCLEGKCSTSQKQRENIMVEELVRLSVSAAADLPMNGVAVEKVSVNPEEDFRKSMYEMMMEKGDVEEDMEELLNCYLLLNPAEHHYTIRKAFGYVWTDLIMSIR